jgi:aspartyl-tRNA(Asn)/glutamyl-tRNA(Gln) amidotransferase subunit C
MQITDEMVEYVAVLSRLKLSEEQRTKVREDLGSIIGYMDILNNLDTEGVEPMSHVFAVKNVFRPDVVEPSFDRAELLAGAPKRDEDAFVVPKTVE